jgi:DNA-binding phage protein
MNLTESAATAATANGVLGQVMEQLRKSAHQSTAETQAAVEDRDSIAQQLQQALDECASLRTALDSTEHYRNMAEVTAYFI